MTRKTGRASPRGLHKAFGEKIALRDKIILRY